MFGLKVDSKLDIYVFFLLSLNVVFVAAALGHLILAHTDTFFDKYDARLVYWKERTEFIFIVSVSVLLIYYHHPFVKVDPMSYETRLLFFMLGWILLVTAKWKSFVTEAPWFEKLTSAFK
jgi:hypothetical protein